MANNDVVTGDLNYADRLWKTADALRGQVDSAEYKNVVLGLLFLKYISDSFESRRDDLRVELTRDGIMGEQLARLLESRFERRGNHFGAVELPAERQGLGRCCISLELIKHPITRSIQVMLA